MRIVPILVENLGAYREVLETVVRYAEGVFLDAGQFDGEIEGRVDKVVEAALSSTMRQVLRPGGKTLDVAVTQKKDTVRVVVDGVEIGSTSSQGQRTLSGIAASLFDTRLDTTSLAVITYKETDLEEDIAEAVWEMFSEHLKDIPVGSLRTLVVLVETPEVDIGRHCSGEISVAYRLTEGGLERRKSWASDKANLLRLRPRGEGLVVFFLGAGFSVSSDLPLGNDLRNSALRTMFNSDEPYSALARQFYESVESDERLLSSEYGKPLSQLMRDLTLERVLREELRDLDINESPTLLKMQEDNDTALGTPGLAVRALCELTRRDERNIVIVTLNFDTLLDEWGNVSVFASDKECAQFPDYLNKYRESGGAVPLLKLHGTLKELKTIVATVDETARGLSIEKISALHALLPEEGRVPWVYVGYSMRDWDVTTVLARNPFGQRLREYWVSPFITRTAEEFVERSRVDDSVPSFWERSITLTADTFFQELKSSWSTK
jgi:hypothetical protein